MNITKAELWDQIYKIVPTYRGVNEYTSIGIQMALMATACNCFVREGTCEEFQTNPDMPYAVHCIRSALTELEKSGCISFVDA